MNEHPRDACRLVGFMPDFPPMYDDLKCWEFLDLFAASYFVPRSARRRIIANHLELVGLTEKANAFVVELSRGMRQRLMLAKTLIPDPQVLLLDEPASGMDPQGRIDLKNVLKELGTQGKTVLISSHILAEMTEFCTAVAIMEKGRMVISGTLDEVRSRVMGSGTIEVELLEPADAFLAIIASDPLCDPVEQRNGLYAFRYRGSAEQTSVLLSTLVGGGVRVVSFSRRREGLEELFLKVGAKELS
jgi:ABC-2 type transport system ATP-binding protein